MSPDRARQGAYLCISAPPDAAGVLAAPVPALAERFALQNEFSAHDGHPQNAVAFLRRVESTAGGVEDEGLSAADAIVHVASDDGFTVAEFCAEVERALSGLARVQRLTGRVAPTQYTGGAMHEFAYARQRTQQGGGEMPNAFLLPLRKTPEWWAKEWMERHTYFLPRYEDGRMVSDGHPLAAAAGIPVLMRRTYRCDDGYDFLTYFECADEDVATFHAVCASLRDVQRNPEWRFVREGPTWRGRRMESWSALWTPRGPAAAMRDR